MMMTIQPRIMLNRKYLRAYKHTHTWPININGRQEKIIVKSNYWPSLFAYTYITFLFLVSRVFFFSFQFLILFDDKKNERSSNCLWKFFDLHLFSPVTCFSFTLLFIARTVQMDVLCYSFTAPRKNAVTMFIMFDIKI